MVVTKASRQSFMGRGVRGMMISRRPKRRASRDRVPGPRGMTAAATTITKPSINFVSNGPRSGRGIKENARPNAPIPTRPPPRGVRNPASSETPITTATQAASQAAAGGLPDATKATPYAITVSPKAARSSSKLKPLAPSKNGENNRFRPILLRNSRNSYVRETQHPTLD